MMTEAISLARRISIRLKPSRKWEPLQPVRVDMRPSEFTGGFEQVQTWENRWYEVTARSYKTGWLLDGGSWVQLGICCQDGEARHDWRDFQRIKNDLCGPDWEAIELYPAESRLIDPSNYYILYCAPKLPFGKNLGRRVIEGPETSMAPQRGWASGDEPTELRNA